MERYERAVAGQREGEEEQGGEVPVPGAVAGAVGGMAREAASSEQEAISETGNAGGHGAAESESDDEEVNKDALTEESVVVAPAGNAGRGVDSRSAQNEDHEMPEENPAPTHFELRGFRAARRAIIRAMPPSSYRHMPLRSRKRPNPTRLNDMGGAGSGGANAHDPGTYSEAAGGPSPSAGFGSAPATPRSVFPSAMVNARHGARNEALGSTARLSVKASDPECPRSWMSFFPFHLIGTQRPPEMDAAVAKPSSGDPKSGTNAKDAAAAASSCHLPSRSRKQRRPEHFTSDSEEAVAVAAARAKAHRSDTALDRFLTSQVGGPEKTDGSARILAVVAILGASLALSAASCLLFYIAGQQTDPRPSDSRKKK
ncbi:hypothetical protein GQ55_5G465200 [Panicum hallii var. hallii]|uniref:Uncharacterized protein n=1 Tax=Panicum hallii var. hallii TaxID=1504633 RepID=A0A2T7DQM6_9POAL|nr:hypothetical protein GQ55_5G465200 [Panicum hallii var. hallii]